MQNPFVNIPKEKIVQPLVGLVYFVILGVFFMSAINKLHEQSNVFFGSVVADVAVSGPPTKMIATIKSKLGIVSAPTPSLPIAVPIPTPVVPTSPASITVTGQGAPVSVVTPSRAGLKIAIFSTIPIRGAAADLKAALEAAGFTVQKVASKHPTLNTTQIQLKYSKKDFADALTEVVAKQYVTGLVTPLPEAGNDYDAIITIGKERAAALIP